MITGTIMTMIMIIDGEFRTIQSMHGGELMGFFQTKWPGLTTGFYAIVLTAGAIGLYFASAVISLTIWAKSQGLIVPPGQGGWLGVGPPEWWSFLYWPVLWIIHETDLWFLKLPFQSTGVWSFVRSKLIRM